jgi:hypothetical protein
MTEVNPTRGGVYSISVAVPGRLFTTEVNTKRANTSELQFVLLSPNWTIHDRNLGSIQSSPSSNMTIPSPLKDTTTAERSRREMRTRPVETLASPVSSVKELTMIKKILSQVVKPMA